MIFNRAKNCKSETPTRTIHHTQKFPLGLGMAKKSDPFLKDLKQIYDKENINPNLKENRVKSQHLKHEIPQKSSNKKTHLQLSNKPNAASLLNRIKKGNQNLGSNSKYNHSAELLNATQGTKQNNRKSTERDEVLVSHFEEQYYNKKEERRDKKMRVTLKDARRHRKSIQQQHEQEYLSKLQQQTKQSFSKDLLSSLKMSSKKQEFVQSNKLKTQESLVSHFSGLDESKCANHPQKRASHRLLQGDNNIILCQKCAINLITKGHQMQQLNSVARVSMHKDDLKEVRLDKLKGFLQEVDKLDPIIKQIWSQIGNCRGLIQRKFDEQTIQLNDYYNKIRSQVEQSYSKSQINLKIYFESVVQEIQKNQDLLKKNQELLKEFKWDILPNISSIIQIQMVAQQNFLQIIQNYYKNLKGTELVLKEISEYSYCFYEYQYDANNLRLPNLKDLLSPQIKVYTLRQKHEANRHTLESSSQQKMDPFRLSFGKRIPDVSHRIL